MSASSSFIKTRYEVESALARKVPSALSPRERTIRELAVSGVECVDSLVGGGLPVGAISEFVGTTGSGRTTAAMAFVAAVVQEARVAAWVDATDAFDPVSAALNGVELTRLLWIRCAGGGVHPQLSDATDASPSQQLITSPMPQAVPACGSSSPHPRSEGLGMPEAVLAMMHAHGGLHDLHERSERKKIGTPGIQNRSLFPAHDREEQVPTDRQPSRSEKAVRRAYSARKVDIQAIEAAHGGPRCAEPKPHRRLIPETAQVKSVVTQAAAAQSRAAQVAQTISAQCKATMGVRGWRQAVKRPWVALDKALRATDLLLQAGGFGLIVLDLGDTPAEMSWRIPLATWFRYRAACERSRAILLLLARHPCARSSAELVVRMDTVRVEGEGNVFTDLRFCAEVERGRFQHSPSEPESNVVAFRKPPQRAESVEPKGTLKVRTSWAV